LVRFAVAVQAVFYMQANGVFDIAQDFLVGIALRVTSLQNGARGKIAIFVFLDDQG